MQGFIQERGKDENSDEEPTNQKKECPRNSSHIYNEKNSPGKKPVRKKVCLEGLQGYTSAIWRYRVFKIKFTVNISIFLSGVYFINNNLCVHFLWYNHTLSCN